MLDGRKHKEYDYDKMKNYGIDEDSMTFSEDGHRLAYIVEGSNGRFVVLDGEEQNKYGIVETY